MVDLGKLYVVATPIGNLGDITVRALAVLREVKLIAAEDTRQSKKLLQHYGISTPLYSLHAHNERTHSAKIIDQLQNKNDVAYITDAGTPLISDPGAYLVKKVRAEGFSVVPVPGPCAAIAALSVSGFSGPHFYFAGFLPHKSSARKEHLSQLKTLPSTLVFYESPHRIIEMLQDLMQIMGNREGVIARELTKRFETVLAGDLETLVAQLENCPTQRLGEFVVMIAGSTSGKEKLDDSIVLVLTTLLEVLPLKKAVEVASKLLDVGKNQLYDRALELKEKGSNSSSC